MSTTTDLRADLIASMVADPEGMAEILLAGFPTVPELEPYLRRRLSGRITTRILTDATPTLPTASPEVLARMQRHAGLVQVRHAIRHPQVVLQGVTADLSVEASTPAIVLGGNVVSRERVAGVITVLLEQGLTFEQAWNQLSDAICAQCGGPLSRHSLTRRTPDPGEAPGARGRRRAEEDALELEEGGDQVRLDCLHLIGVDWPPAAGIPRERHETTQAYLLRVVSALRFAVQQGDADAIRAFAASSQAYPQLLQ